MDRKRGHLRGTNGRLPDRVFVSPGSRTFHVTRQCQLLWYGLDAAAKGRGNAQSEINEVGIVIAATDRQATLCQECFPDPLISIDFGRLRDSVVPRRRSKGTSLTVDDYKRYVAAGIDGDSCVWWWDSGFTPAMAETCLEAGYARSRVQERLRTGESSQAIHREACRVVSDTNKEKRRSRPTF
jgi:hypothetical protein